MADAVNAADVLDDYLAWDPREIAEGQVAALLACGDGDPVVIMPDGTLRRLTQARATSVYGTTLWKMADLVGPT